MKSKICIILIMQVLLLFTSCGKAGEEVQDLQSMPVITATGVDLTGVKTNNDPILDTAQKLPISELKNYFENDLTKAGPLFLEEINQKFPVEYLRSMSVSENRESYYIAYPVLEGGLYVVFLTGAMSNDGSAFKLAALNSIYLSELPEKRDLNILQPGDTFDDVKRIAPATLLTTTKSSAITSVSILQDGLTAEIDYQKEAYLDSGNLLIERITFNDQNAFILQEDLSYIQTAERDSGN